MQRFAALKPIWQGAISATATVVAGLLLLMIYLLLT